MQTPPLAEYSMGGGGQYSLSCTQQVRAIHFKFNARPNVIISKARDENDEKCVDTVSR
jgi:hypothetical protein